MRTDPFRDLDRLTQALMGTPGRKGGTPPERGSSGGREVVGVRR
jgi:hypothetical protein